jgi:hypothetical protein
VASLLLHNVRVCNTSSSVAWQSAGAQSYFVVFLYAILPPFLRACYSVLHFVMESG